MSDKIQVSIPANGKTVYETITIHLKPAKPGASARQASIKKKRGDVKTVEKRIGANASEPITDYIGGVRY